MINMKQPQNYELKAWLCDHLVKGLIVHYHQTGTKSSSTDCASTMPVSTPSTHVFWELIPTEGKPLRVKVEEVLLLVTLELDGIRVMNVKDSVRREVKEYRDFVKREADDLAHYERLKKKFGE